MALKKQVNFKGVSAEYWKILSVDYNVSTNKTSITAALYKDATSRSSNLANWLSTSIFMFDGGDFTRAELYAKLKALDQFKNAEDC